MNWTIGVCSSISLVSAIRVIYNRWSIKWHINQENPLKIESLITLQSHIRYLNLHKLWPYFFSAWNMYMYMNMQCSTTTQNQIPHVGICITFVWHAIDFVSIRIYDSLPITYRECRYTNGGIDDIGLSPGTDYGPAD